MPKHSVSPTIRALQVRFNDSQQTDDLAAMRNTASDAISYAIELEDKLDAKTIESFSIEALKGEIDRRVQESIQQKFY